MNNNWLVLGLLCSPCLYLLVTLVNRPSRGETDFEFGSRKLHPSQVLDSSITYSLQVAAIALFATWGYQFGLHALWVPLFWFLGYALLAWRMDGPFLEKFAQDTEFRTLHSFIADRGRSRMLCVAAALVTLVALAGPAMYEAFTVGSTVARSLPSFGPATGAGIALAFLAMSIVYIMWGGFRGVVRLDRWQLATGFGGFCIALALALALFAARIGYEVALKLAVFSLLTTAVMAAAKIWYEVITYRYLDAMPDNTGPPRTLDVIGLVAILGSLCTFIVLVIFLFFSRLPTLPDNVIRDGGLSSQFGFEALAFISLLLANALFQFVDITQWQRLLSIAVDRDSLGRTVNILRGNILIGGLCGSCTWFLAVFFGIFFRHLLPTSDPYGLLPAVLSEVLASPNPLSSWLAFVYIVALVSIMSSTVDAMVSATAFTVRNDLISIGLGRAGRSISGSSVLPRLATIIVILIQLGIYLAVSELAKEHVDAVLYVCYSCQLALLPSVVAMIAWGGGSHSARLMSMLAGCLASGIPLYVGQPERAYELSPILSVAASWAVFVVISLIRRAPPAASE